MLRSRQPAVQVGRDELVVAQVVAVPARRGRPRYGRELSPREREVLDLLGRGSTNREIAARLYLSERTVEGHLARLRTKLGVRSRRELREQAHQATA